MKCLIYCTMGKPYIVHSEDDYKRYVELKTDKLYSFCINGKVVAEFNCDKGIIASALQVSNLKALDEPLYLDDFTRPTKCRHCEKCEHKNNEICDKGFVKVFDEEPQNMCYVWYEGELCVLISIQPKSVCKFLNGEDTIKDRKVILNKLKEMIV